ncbi:hypothetical protein [Elizabethkingia anophelis]|uniref:hypothetical protein n=1 Tax=Elizabethkingia anophelis TaxID=1117645 RepID=UPI0038913060
MKLFDEIQRTFLKEASANEEPYDYYNRSARKDITIIRELLEDWFSNLPHSEKFETKKRFKKSFDSVFYELFLYNFFKKLGFSIIIHPVIKGSSKKPDFLIKNNDLEIYIEAKICKDKSHEVEATENLKQRFYDTLNKIESPYFMFCIDTFNLKSTNQPKTKEIVSLIKIKLKELDYYKYLNLANAKNYDSFESIYYSNEEIDLNLLFLPVKEKAIGKNRRSIGVYPMDFAIGGSKYSIRDSINLKAKRYGKLDKPYIICVNNLSITSSPCEDIEDAIWGSLAYNLNNNMPIRQNDGVFYNNNTKKNLNVSGILINKIFPHNIPNSNYWLFQHPFSENELDFMKLGLPFYYVDNDNRIIKNVGNNLDEIFNINKKWLANS